MKIALDPFMHRHLSLEDLPGKVKELGYDWIELSPRGDFLEWFKAPRVFPDRVRANLELTQGLVFSGTLLLELTNDGLRGRLEMRQNLAQDDLV